LVHGPQRQCAEVVELAYPAEMEDGVAVDDALDPPQQCAEDDGCRGDGRPAVQALVAGASPERKCDEAGAENESEREPQRSADGERERERARDDCHRPGKGRGRAAAAERTCDEHARQQEYRGCEREAEPEDHSARMTSRRRRSRRPRTRIGRAARAYAEPWCFARKRSWLRTFSASIRPPCAPP